MYVYIWLLRPSLYISISFKLEHLIGAFFTCLLRGANTDTYPLITGKSIFDCAGATDYYEGWVSASIGNSMKQRDSCKHGTGKYEADRGRCNAYSGRCDTAHGKSQNHSEEGAIYSEGRCDAGKGRCDAQ